jgi:SpoVK/Ycf46/Vps4 family AAA+-type ATPase
MEWFERDLVAPFSAGLASVFILHGDVNALVRNPDEDDEPDAPYVPMKRFFEKVFGKRELVITYNIANGAWMLTKEMEKTFRRVVGIDDPKADPAADPVAAAKAGLAAKRGLPREPEACLPLIELALRKMESVAVIIQSAHFIAPNAVGAALPQNERVNINRLSIWGQSTQIRERKNIVLLQTDQIAKISSELRLPSTGIRSVFVPKPDKDVRRDYLSVDGKPRKGKKAIDLEALVHATQGMSLLQIEELSRQAEADKRALDLSFVKAKKRSILKDEYGEVMDVIEPERGLEDIGGHEHIKRYFRGVLDAIRRGERRLVPMGVTLMGPPGTGKTAIVEALAKEAGFNFVAARNIRSMWVGESEARMEKFIYGLRSLAPVVVMNDEADLAEAGRDSQKGDSGVSERIMKMWMELLSDPSIRGQIIVISCTNRPDRIDPALKRSGRSDERILMPMPALEDRAAIFPVMLRRHKLPTDLTDFSQFAAATDGLSGADLEKITLGSFQFAAQRGLEKIDAAALLEAIGDFIPSNSQADIDSMTLGGLLECSSRRLLPPRVGEIVDGIRRRGLITGIDEAFALLRDRNILPPAAILVAATGASDN